MANAAIFDQGTDRVLQYLTSIHTPDYSSRPDVVIDPDISGFATVPIKYWKHVAGTIQEMTAGEKTQVDSDEAAALLAVLRAGAKDLFDTIDIQGKALRAFASIVTDEVNNLRQWIASFKTETAAATSLANFQARVASLPNTPDRTLAQLKTAIQNLIDAGTVD